MKTILFLVCVASAWAQGPAVNQVDDPPPTAVQKLFFRDGSGNLKYACKARQFQPNTTFQRRSDSTLTSIGVANGNPGTGTVITSAAHGLYVGARVTVSGATVDTDLNGTYTVLTVADSTHYTFATPTAIGTATYTESTLVISTNNPLTTSGVWAIEVLVYDGSNNLDASSWAAATTAYTLACTSRTTY